MYYYKCTWRKIYGKHKCFLIHQYLTMPNVCKNSASMLFFFPYGVLSHDNVIWKLNRNIAKLSEWFMFCYKISYSYKILNWNQNKIRGSYFYKYVVLNIYLRDCYLNFNFSIYKQNKMFNARNQYKFIVQMVRFIVRFNVLYVLKGNKI